MISDEIFLAINKGCDFEDYTFGSPHNESKSCNDAIAEANAVVGQYVNNYDVILDVCYPSIVMQELRLRKYVCLFPHGWYMIFTSKPLIAVVTSSLCNLGDQDQFRSGCLHVI